MNRPHHHHRSQPAGKLVDDHGHHEFISAPHPDDENPRPVTDSMAIVELRRRHDGWTAERQRVFLNTFANTGSVAHAAQAADITRARPIACATIRAVPPSPGRGMRR